MFRSALILCGLLVSQSSFALDYYQLCCSFGPRVKLLIRTFEHSRTARQYNVEITGLKSHTAAAGAQGINLPQTGGVCAWVDRPVFTNPEQSVEIRGSWLSEITSVVNLTSVIPGRGVETHLYFPVNDFNTGNFALASGKFCINARSYVGSPVGLLDVQPGARWWINPPAILGDRQ